MRCLYITISISGAYILILLEQPYEEEMRIAKQNKTRDVDEAVTYLKGIFWTYANNERYNYSKEEYHDAVSLKRYSVFHRFGQAKFASGGTILSLSQFLLLP
jgi:hypothetical protein